MKQCLKAFDNMSFDIVRLSTKCHLDILSCFVSFRVKQPSAEPVKIKKL
jgi:hypothetical protein